LFFFSGFNPTQYTRELGASPRGFDEQNLQTYVPVRHAAAGTHRPGSTATVQAGRHEGRSLTVASVTAQTVKAYVGDELVTVHKAHLKPKGTSTASTRTSKRSSGRCG